MKKSNTFFTPCTILHAMTKKVWQKAKQNPIQVGCLPLILFIPWWRHPAINVGKYSLQHQVLESSARVRQKRCHQLESFCPGLILVIHIKHKICVYCCHNQPKVGNEFFELISSSDAAEKELSSKSKIVFL